MAEGLLAVWVDMPPAHQSEFEKWYDHEHLPERAAVPGFLSAARFFAVDTAEQAQRHMALYELTSVAVLDSPAYRILHERPQTPLADLVRAKRERQERCVYQKVSTDGKREASHKPLRAEYVASERLAASGRDERKVRAWLVEQLIPRRLALTGVEVCHLFEVLDGQFAFLLLWELVDPLVADQPGWRVAGGPEISRRVTRVYRRVTTLR